jgi:YHS domain-containing protein
MKVDRAEAVTKEFAGEPLYFCSAHCLHAFELDPWQYISTTHVAVPIDHGVAENRSVIAATDGDSSTAQAIDPICGMTVGAATAPHADHNGHRYFFCGTGCRKRFQEDPEQYDASPLARPSEGRP